jgi:hypothetical protein
VDVVGLHLFLEKSKKLPFERAAITVKPPQADGKWEWCPGHLRQEQFDLPHPGGAKADPVVVLDRQGNFVRS